MSRRISFKLYSKDVVGNSIDELALSLAFQRHCHVNLGLNDDLNILVKKVWIKFLRDSVDRAASKAEDLDTVGVADASGDDSVNGEVTHAGGKGVTVGDTVPSEISSEGAAPAALADSPDVSGPVASV